MEGINKNTIGGVSNLSEERPIKIAPTVPEHVYGSEKPLAEVPQARNFLQRLLDKMGTPAKVGVAAGGLTAATVGAAAGITHLEEKDMDKVANMGLPNLQGNEVSQTRKELEAKGLKLGDVRASARRIDPVTGKEGTIMLHGSLGESGLSGTVGVSTEVQPVIIRSDEPSMEGKQVTTEELAELGVNTNDIWMTQVYGGPDSIPQPGKEAQVGDWVKFSAKGKDGTDHTFFAAEKFAKPDGKKMLELNTDVGVVQVPFTPINQ